MLHITEDMPPDMLAGAMDLTVHLPDNRTVKMAVERSTPMMDLLVQITTNNHLQLSNHTLQVLGMAPSVEHSDKVLPFKPNTPIGALDTQHIKVLPKGKTLPAPKQPPPPGHQPFESTFRLKVHLPRNQLYVTRVSRNVYLEDIMRKVCEEKNLDPTKFELKHPGNLEETLDPKLTLSDYQITEIYIVHKGTSNLSQALSSTDIMTLRKEEERKQMHNKTGGGVFNLIFKRNKSSMGSGSVSSDTRSLSPTQSDDSRSVTPPGVQAPPIVAPPKREPPERPKPPQRKRRPAPLPPQGASHKEEQGSQISKGSQEDETATLEISKDAPEPSSHSSVAKKSIVDNGLTICHSRNSSDSSGYHEASILSDHNASLPRTRPKSAFVTTEMHQTAMGAGGSNLAKMSAHSRSTTCLVTGKKKKAPAPPPPPSSISSLSAAAVVPVSPSGSVVSASSEKPSPLVASQTIPNLSTDPSEVQESTLFPTTSNPKPLPRKRIGTSGNSNRNSVASVSSLGSSLNLESPEINLGNIVITSSDIKPPKPKPRKERTSSQNSIESLNHFEELESKMEFVVLQTDTDLINKRIIDEILQESLTLETVGNGLNSVIETSEEVDITKLNSDVELKKSTDIGPIVKPSFLLGNENSSIQNNSNNIQNTEPSLEEMLCSLEAINSFTIDETASVIQQTSTSVSQIQKHVVTSIFSSKEFLKESGKPEIVGVIRKSPKVNKCFSFDDNKDDGMHDVDQDMFEEFSSMPANATETCNPSLNYEPRKHLLRTNLSTTSLGSLESNTDNAIFMKKWSNTEKLDDSSLTYFAVKNDWVTGEADEADSVTSCNTPLDTPQTPPIDTSILDHSIEEEKTLESTDSGIAQDKQSDTEKSTEDLSFSPAPIFETVKNCKIETLESDLKNVSRTNIGLELEKQISDIDLKSETQELDEKINQPVNDVNEDNIVQKTVVNNISKTFIGSSIGHESQTKNLEKRLKENTIKPTPIINTPKTYDINADNFSNNSTVNRLEKHDNPSVNLMNGKENELNTKTLNDDLTQPKPENFKEEIKPPSLDLKQEKETDLFDMDWHYELPSPPTAFRDSPTNLTEKNDCDAQSMTDFKDSVATQPELFERLHHNQFEADVSEAETLKSETTSIASEEIMNTLTLENLEKRKSLVYNRELATSLKLNDNTLHQELLRDFKTSKPSRSNDINTLPNFKITTYDVPKQKIKVFEDDTIRSNVNNLSNLRRSNFAQSMENVSSIGPSVVSRNYEDQKSYGFFRPKSSNLETNNAIQRSESFFSDRTNFRPVSRSQSHLTLNRFRDGRMDKSNSSMDVSGLQSIGVMRLIQNRLSTPTSSLENLSQTSHYQQTQHLNSTTSTLTEEPESNMNVNETNIRQDNENRDSEEIIVDRIQKHQEIYKNIQKETSEPKPQHQPEKVYHYSGPPNINMATWSERPKVPVHVREDPDYKLGNHDNTSSSNVTITTKNNLFSSNNNRVEINNLRNNADRINHGNVSVIKINAHNPEVINKNHYTKNFENSRFQAPSGYRKPFQNIEKNTLGYNAKQRPHSIAFDSDFDISRIPVVRSVEFKKPYKDIYTSVTHINPKNDTNIDNSHGYNNNITENDHLHNKNNITNFESKVLRANSFRTLDSAPPVVRGFRNPANPSSRLSWNPQSYSTNTLPAKAKLEPSYTTNQHVPFSQLNLRRTDSNRLLKEEAPPSLNKTKANTIEEPQFKSLRSFNLVKSLDNDRINKRNVPQNYTPPPPPPQMPTVALRKVPQKEVNSQKSPVDPRDMLLESIRSFGGKKGLKRIKS